MPKHLTAQDLAHAISQLPKGQAFHYINPATTGQIEVVRVDLPEGPIVFKRYDPTKGKTPAAAKEETISTQMLWRVANAVHESFPLNIDRVLGASYNSRSVLESLLAHSPQFYYAYPGRIESIAATVDIKEGHKHLIWLPNSPHALGTPEKAETDVVISELPAQDVIYDALQLPSGYSEDGMDIAVARRHSQIQIALIRIGICLGFGTWIAKNDHGIVSGGKKLIEMDGVIKALEGQQLLSSFPEAVKAALLIDCIWFKNGKLMPAVMEVEHTTGVTTGLSRMQNFSDKVKAFKTRYVVVAPDEDRDLVVRESNKEQFRGLDARFFPYSAVEELYRLCQRRNIAGVGDSFIESFMEPMVINAGRT